MSEAVCEFLPWDSEHFGFRIGRVLGDTLDANNVVAIDEWARVEGIRCLYFLARPDDAMTIRLARQHHYSLVDVRMTLAMRLGAPEPRAVPVREIRAAGERDVPILEQIAEGSYVDSRYYFDPGYTEELCSALYRRWIRNSVEGYADRVLTIVDGGHPAGFITCHLEQQGTRGRIGLVGVGGGHRGAGLGAALVAAAVAWFTGEGAGALSVVTQGRNIAAQRLYQGAGFRTTAVGLYHHRWFDNRP